LNQLNLKNFEYSLPDSLIAQNPIPFRDHSRLMIVSRSANYPNRNMLFKDIVTLLHPDDLLILNNVRVTPVRLFANRQSGGVVEIFLLDPLLGVDSEVLISPARRIKVGEVISLGNSWQLKVTDRIGEKFKVKITGKGNLNDFLDSKGLMPVPPYIHREKKSVDYRRSIDFERYQTVYAEKSGAIAAPTAGLHFTNDLLLQIKKKGVQVVFLTLYVGWGTFKPIDSNNIEEHKMGAELFEINQAAAENIRQARSIGKRLIAVGTTTTRALESWINISPELSPMALTKTDLFIKPGYEFKMVQGLITNFHLPKSTLLILVSTFSDRKRILEAYTEAIHLKYRFYSYGDAMFIA
jgi:S-adenosylmethionine:tRNA ribosyltransferase-isomerase